MPRAFHQAAMGSRSSQGDPMGLGCLVPPQELSALPVSPTCPSAGASSTQRGPCLQVSVRWLSPGPRARGAPHAGGEMGPTLLPNPIASVTAHPGGLRRGVGAVRAGFPLGPGWDGRKVGPSLPCPRRFPCLPGPAGGLAAHPAAAAGLPPARPLHRLQVSTAPLPPACRHSQQVTGPFLFRQRAGAEVLPADPGGA